MKGNILYITGMILIFCLIGTVSAAETTFYVNNGVSCDDETTASTTTPYCTIQAAIDDAEDSDTIEVAAGTYTNDIWNSSLGIPAGYRITKNITLLGAQAGVDPAGSTDRGGETILVKTNGVPYSLYVSGITIDGFTFTSGGGSGGGRLVIADTANDVTIKNCIIKDINGTDPHGVYIYSGAGNALIEYNTFYNTAWEAIASNGASNAVISHNHISASGEHAIQWMNHAGIDNEISYNHISGIIGKNAIQYWGGPGAIITNNVIVGERTMYDGIWLDSAADESTVNNNQISDTIYAGINVRDGCSDAEITYNNISGCGTGVETHIGTTGALVNYNNIEGNRRGVWNYDTEILNAEYNWWGHPSGPSGEGPGLGDAVSVNVDYNPWYNTDTLITKTYYVGSVEDYTTIQSAIDAANDDDTIMVAAGTYTNDIWNSSLDNPASYRITKSITLLGAQAGVDPAGSTDRGGETILVKTNGVPYSLYVSGITIDGFTFTSGGGSGGGRLVIADTANDVTIKNCIIKDISGTDPHGVYIYSGAGNALIEYNTFYNTAWEAIASNGASNAVISHNHISASGEHAIQWMNHAGTDNEISYNHISGIIDKNAIQYWGGSGAIITNNVIDGGNTMFDGIWLDSAADGSSVSYNQISDTIYAGITVRGDCTGATVTNNDISGCGTGVETHIGTTGALVNYNNIAGNSRGVWNYDTELLNAEYNWWGHPSGPSGEGDGKGDAVSANVDYEPWLSKHPSGKNKA